MRNVLRASGSVKLAPSGVGYCCNVARIRPDLNQSSEQLFVYMSTAHRSLRRIQLRQTILLLIPQYNSLGYG